MAREPLSEVINLRLSKTELRMLAELSGDSGLPMSAIIRQAVRREHSRQIGRALPSIERRFAEHEKRILRKLR